MAESPKYQNEMLGPDGKPLTAPSENKPTRDQIERAWRTRQEFAQGLSSIKPASPDNLPQESVDVLAAAAGELAKEAEQERRRQEQQSRDTKKTSEASFASSEHEGKTRAISSHKVEAPKPQAERSSPDIEATIRKFIPEIVAFFALEAGAIPFFHAGAEAMLNDHLERGAIGYAVGGVFALAGLTFHWWKRLFSQTGFERAIMWWPILFVAFFAYVAGPEMYRRATVSTANSSPPPSPIPPPSLAPLLITTAQSYTPTADTPITISSASGSPTIVTAQELLNKIDNLQTKVETVTNDLEETKKQLQAARTEPTKIVLTPQPTNQPSPIFWTTDSQLIVASGGAPNPRINGMVFFGTSTTQVAIKDAFVLSALTGRRQKLLANVQSRGAYYAVDKVDIPPEAPVQLDVNFDPDLSVRDFLDQWGKFSFVVIYADGKSYEREYQESFVRQKIKQMVPTAFGPRVTPKDDK